MTKLLTFVTLFILARYLGSEAFGRYSVAVAIPLVLDIVSDLGLTWAVVREGAGRPEVLRRDLADILPLKVLLAVVLVIVSWLAALALAVPEEVVVATVFLAVARAFDSLTHIARSVFEAVERMEFEAITNVLDAAARFGFTLYALLAGFGLVGLAQSLAASGLVVLLVSAAIARYWFAPELPPPQPQRWGHLILAGAPFAVLAFFELVTFRTQIVLASTLGGDAVAGLFSAAVRVVEATVIFPGMLGVALFPIAARHATHPSDAALAALWVGAGKASLTVAVGGALVVAGLAPIVVPVLFGDPFAQAVVLVQLVCLAMPALFLKFMITRFLLALRAPWRLAVTALLAPVLASIAGVLLVPNLAAIGAALGLVIGEVGAAIIGLAFLGRERHRLWNWSILLPAVPGVPASVVLVIALPWQPVVATVLAVALFMLGVRASRVFTVREIDHLRRSVPWLAPVGTLLLGQARAESGP